MNRALPDVPISHTGRGRIWALIRKESRQMLRDKSTLTLGIVLPVLLLLLFGFGLSLDVRQVPVAVVRDSSSPATRDMFIHLNLSPYFKPSLTSSWREAEALFRAGKVDAIVRRTLRDRAASGEEIQIIVNGRDSNTARIMRRYLEGALTQWLAGRGEREDALLAGRAAMETRIWYNHALESRFFLVPGVTALIMTLIGTLLTSLVIAREWERGTYEALAATPVKRHELVAGKTVPYFGLGLAGLCLCLAAAALVFHVPMRGSLLLIMAGSSLYLLVALGLGLLISARVKNQFLACQLAIVVSFIPTLMLSGFIFDLKSAPRAAYYIAHLFPATWYVDLLQTLFLAGNVTGLIVQDMFALLVFAVCFIGLAGKYIVKSLE